jgi:SnoaL-like domain
MSNSGELLARSCEAVRCKDIDAVRQFVDKDLVFVGLFETYPDAESYLRALTGFLSITTRLTIKKIIGEADYAAVFFELVTTAPAAATTLVAELHEVRSGKIVRVRSSFDGRPFAAMFGS